MRFPIRHCAPILALLAAAGPAYAASEHFVLDPVHTRIAFRVDHLGLSQAIGTLSGVHGTLDFDPADWRGAKLDASVPLDRLDLGDADWKIQALSGVFLDIARQPVAQFHATGIEPIDATHARVTGTLSLRGQQHPLVLAVTFNGIKRSLYTRLRKTAGFSATATVHRADWGMLAFGDVVGMDVAIDIQVEAIAQAPDPHAASAGAPAAGQAPR